MAILDDTGDEERRLVVLEDVLVDGFLGCPSICRANDSLMMM